MRYWKRVKAGKTTTVESYSHNLDIPGAKEITEQEYNDFIASLPEPVMEPPIDVRQEIANIKARLDTIEQTTK
jgi:hypothetical protein